MIKLSDLLKKKRLTNVEIRNVLRNEFIRRGHQPSRESASMFSEQLEREYPRINQWIARSDPVSHRNIEDLIMDEFKIP